MRQEVTTCQLGQLRSGAYFIIPHHDDGEVFQVTSHNQHIDDSNTYAVRLVDGELKKLENGTWVMTLQM